MIDSRDRLKLRLQEDLNCCRIANSLLFSNSAECFPFRIRLEQFNLSTQCFGVNVVTCIDLSQLP